MSLNQSSDEDDDDDFGDAISMVLGIAPSETSRKKGTCVLHLMSCCMYTYIETLKYLVSCNIPNDIRSQRINFLMYGTHLKRMLLSFGTSSKYVCPTARPYLSDGIRWRGKGQLLRLVGSKSCCIAPPTSCHTSLTFAPQYSTFTTHSC